MILLMVKNYSTYLTFEREVPMWSEAELGDESEGNRSNGGFQTLGKGFTENIEM